MAAFTDHLLSGSYPYLTPEEFINSCKLASSFDSDDDAVLDAVEDASLIVYYLTGRQFDGITEATVYPDCQGSVSRLNLGLWPITKIVSVTEFGEAKDVDEYHVDEYRYIVKNDCSVFRTCTCQDCENPLIVTVEYGMEVPRLVRRATKALACALFADANECEDCSIPDNVRNITRQGVSYEIEDIPSLIRDGSTGIYALDLAVKVLNPTAMQSPTILWTPDMRRSSRKHT